MPPWTASKGARACLKQASHSVQGPHIEGLSIRSAAWIEPEALGPRPCLKSTKTRRFRHETTLSAQFPGSQGFGT